MKARNIVVLCLVVFASIGLCFADDVNLGTWKLNEAKSKIEAGFPKNTKVVYEAAGDMIKTTVEGVDAKGNPTHNEWTGKYDGKDYPVTGDPSSDMRALKKINDHTMELTVKKGGKVTITGKIVVAADGKSRTLTATGTDPMGKKVHSVSFYDKQ
jgi:hypothetical protein